MDLATIVISPDEAEAKLAGYARQIEAERTAEDRAIAAGYRAARRGLAVISMSRTIARGGFHENSLPRLAVIRAAAREAGGLYVNTECFARWSGDSIVYSDRDDLRVNRGALAGEHSVRVPLAGDDLPARHARRDWRAGSCMVPLIPAEHRPKPRRMHGFHILWEVDQWAWVAPEDPALLRHIRGDLWAVVAEWNLTELERLVLSQR